MKIKLNHICRMEGCEGMPGEVIDVSRDLAKMLLDRNGATIVDGKKSNQDVETATDSADENAATQTDQPKSRKSRKSRKVG